MAKNNNKSISNTPIIFMRHVVNLTPKFHKKKRNICKTFVLFFIKVFNRMKFVLKAFIITLFARVNTFEKTIATFFCNFIYSKYDSYKVFTM